MKKILLSILSSLLLLSFLGPWSNAQANSAPAMKMLNAPQNKIDAALNTRLSTLQSGEMLTVIVTLLQQADLTHVNGADRATRQQGVIRALQATADATQNRLKGLLNARLAQGSVKSYKALWVFNGFSVTATSAVINELAQHPDVFFISSDDLQIVPAFGPAEPNIALINAPVMWNQGYAGQGVVVANMDSGVNVNHPDLSTRWRGGSNSWFDPYGQHPATPTDVSGHGTWTMGVMVGGDASGTTVGAAPNAQWIAVKIFNDAGSSTATAIHQGFQWLLDPDGNPNTTDAPNVVNNSWTYANPGCYLDFEPDLQSLRAAGILPVFAAGNGGPSGNTSYSPSNNPSAFAVGAINNSSQIYAYSSRCGVQVVASRRRSARRGGNSPAPTPPRPSRSSPTLPFSPGFIRPRMASPIGTTRRRGRSRVSRAFFPREAIRSRTSVFSPRSPTTATSACRPRPWSGPRSTARTRW